MKNQTKNRRPFCSRQNAVIRTQRRNWKDDDQNQVTAN